VTSRGGDDLAGSLQEPSLDGIGVAARLPSRPRLLASAAAFDAVGVRSALDLVMIRTWC